ncbi:MAG TPA: universal stress protein [Candidatus Dormibacteraeota bacterium]|nr:universal stress protein [Candidatus Dormibacteraeota bacterium]
MADIKTVLCPIDFSDLSRSELALAIEVCAAFDARLIMHHNLAAVPPGLTRQWEWDQYHQAGYINADETEARLRALLTEVPAGVSAEATVSRGPVGLVLLDMTASLPADLVVLGYHGLKDLDHASVTERMLDQSGVPLLTIHEGAAIDGFNLRGGEVPVLVPVDLADSAAAVTDYAVGLARKLPLHLHFLHVAPSVASASTIQAAEHTLRTLVPSDLAGRATCHIARGNAVGHILEAAERLQAGFMVLGEHTRGLLLSLFVRDNARTLLEKAVCPVWFVPPRRR